MGIVLGHAGGAVAPSGIVVLLLKRRGCGAGLGILLGKVRLLVTDTEPHTHTAPNTPFPPKPAHLMHLLHPHLLQDIKFNVHAHPTVSEVIEMLMHGAHVDLPKAGAAPGKPAAKQAVAA